MVLEKFFNSEETSNETWTVPFESKDNVPILRSMRENKTFRSNFPLLCKKSISTYFREEKEVVLVVQYIVQKLLLSHIYQTFPI